MYKVIRKFQDKDGHVYNVNDVYPHADVKKNPTAARVKTLSSTNNKYGHIYIEKIETAAEEV